MIMVQEMKIENAVKEVMNAEPMKLEAIICISRVHSYYTELFKNEDGKIMCVTKEYEEDGETLRDHHSFIIPDDTDILKHWSSEMLEYYHLSVECFRDLAYGKMTATLYPCKGKILDV